MPRRTAEAVAAAEAEATARIVQGSDPLRGCNRSFAELWRLKVHFRAPPDVRGSGKERGHGTELTCCPKCGKELKPGRHHVGCAAGKSAPRQAAKRQRQLSRSSEDDEAGSSEGEDGAAVRPWETAVRRKLTRAAAVQRDSGETTGDNGDASSVGQPRASEDSCRMERLHQGLEAGDLVFTASGVADPYGMGGADGAAAASEPSSDPVTMCTSNHPGALGSLGGMGALGGGAGGVASALPLDPDLPPGSPSCSFMAELLHRSSTAHGGSGGGEVDHEDLDVRMLLPSPSPPPVPSDWDAGPGMLFDFDQFDAGRQRMPAACMMPLVTATSAMSPSEIANPSDDYIWQILFAEENDPVPKRVTAHLHHPAGQQLQQQQQHSPGGSGATAALAAPPLRPAALAPMPLEDLLRQPSESEPPHTTTAVAPQTFTVTYVVHQGPAGQQLCSVQSVQDGHGGPPGGGGLPQQARAAVAGAGGLGFDLVPQNLL